MTLQNEQVAHAELVGEAQTTKHSHPGGGGVNVKSGTVAASINGTDVTFNTPFVSVPQVVLTVQDNIALRDCLYQITAVSVDGFSFDVDANATYAWIATDAGDP